MKRFNSNNIGSFKILADVQLYEKSTSEVTETVDIQATDKNRHSLSHSQKKILFLFPFFIKSFFSNGPTHLGVEERDQH